MVEEWPDVARQETNGALEIVPLVGPIPKRAKTLETRYDAPDATLGFITNIESYWREPLASAILARRFDFVIFDESQKIKAAGSKASRFAYQLGLRTPYRLIMTGTPFHDKPLDIYGQYRFINPFIFGTNFGRFSDRYAIKEPIYGKPGIFKVVGYQREEELNRKVYDVAFRVEDDVLDLPPVVTIERKVRLNDKARRYYEQLKEEFVASLTEEHGTLIAPNALAKLLRLQQITTGILPFDDDESGTRSVAVVGTEKYDALVSLLEELSEDEPVVVFGRFSHDLKVIATAAKTTGRRYFEQSGTSDGWRDWRADTTGAVIGIQSQSGNAGINLTRARYAVFLSYTFSYGDYQQALKRLNRPGQKDTLFVYHINASDTVDGYIRRTLASKHSVSTELLRQDFMNNSGREVLLSRPLLPV